MSGPRVPSRPTQEEWDDETLFWESYATVGGLLHLDRAGIYPRRIRELAFRVRWRQQDWAVGLAYMRGGAHGTIQWMTTSLYPPEVDLFWLEHEINGFLAEPWKGDYYPTNHFSGSALLGTDPIDRIMQEMLGSWDWQLEPASHPNDHFMLSLCVSAEQGMVYGHEHHTCHTWQKIPVTIPFPDDNQGDPFGS